MSGTVREFSKECWTEVMNRVIGAVVFLDEPSAENLHWHGGLSSLLRAGAVAVKTLSPFECASEDQKKALFVSSCTATQLQSMREIIRHSNLSQCILAATASLDVVGGEVAGDAARDGGDINPIKLIENMLMQWINKKQSSVEVVHIPIFTISPTPLTFLTPAFADLAPTFCGQLLPGDAAVDLYALAEDERAAVRRLAGCLSSMLEAMNVREDIFYMGAFSSLIAGVLEYSPVCSARRKSCTRPASLIIVDRSLDLCAATSHTSDCLIDKVLSVLPSFPGHSTDVAVDVSPLCQAKMLSLTDDIQLSPGCLWHSDDDVCIQTFEHMMHKTQKEVLFHLNNKLSHVEVPRSPGHGAARVTPATLDKVVNSARGNYDVIESNLGLLQQALGVTQTLKSPQHAAVELLQGLERQALQNIATSRDSTSVLNQISHLIKTRKDRNLSLERLLSLTVFVYSLAGHEVRFSPSHQDNLLKTLSAALFEDHQTLLPEEKRCVSPEECEHIAEGIMERLSHIGQTRKILNKYSSVLKPSASGALEYRGVLEQLVEDLVDPSRPELTDLKHRNDGIKDLLRTGFNMLISNSPKKKHPLDNPLVLVFVTGGATAEEWRRVRRAVTASGTDARVLLGATRLAHPVWSARKVLKL